MRTLLRGWFVLWVIGLTALSAPGDLLINGSFEAGAGTNIDNWVLVPTAAAGTTGGYPAATGTSPYGPRFLTFNAGLNTPGGSATQDIAALDGLTTYELSFAYGAIGTSGAQTLQVTINTGSAPLPAQTYIVSTPSLDFGTLWQRATYTFVGTLNQVPSGITFADLGVSLTGDSDLLVDDVSLVAVPEPFLLGWIGVGGLLLQRRRIGARFKP